MIVSPKLCIKCGDEIYRKNKIGPNYRQWKIERESVGNKAYLVIASCNKCKIEDGDLGKIQKALAKYWGSFNEKLVRVDSYQEASELNKLSQDGKCIVCMEDLGETYVTSNGMYFHEKCPLSKRGRKIH